MSDHSGNRRRLSLAMIVRNDESGVAETLAAMRHVVDEVVILDTGSSDRTPQVVEQFGCKAHKAAWEDSFATARNQALTHVTGDWVLWLDAGERLDRAEAQLLREFIDEQADPAAVYLLRVAVPAAENQIGGEQVARVRLHPVRPGLQFHGRVRESLDRSLAAFNLRRDHLPLVIQRGAREHDDALKQKRAERNIRLADLQIAQRGPSADLLNCLGEAFQTLGDIERAAKQYRSAQEIAEPGSAALLESYYGLLTCMDGSVTDRSAQLQTCMRGVEAFPLDAQLLCALGGYLQAMGHYELAGRAYDVAAGHGQIESEIWHLPDIREIAATCRAIVLQLQGQDAAARASLIEARQSFPQSLRLARQLVELLAKEGNQDEAMAVLNDLPRETPQLDALRSAVRGVCLAVHGKWIAAKAYLETAYRAGCRERLCLRWMVVSCLALQQRDEAREALEGWEMVDAGNAEIAQFRAALGAERVQPTRETAPPSNPAPEAPVPQVPSRAGSLRLDAAGRATPAPKPHSPATAPRPYEAPTTR